MKLSNPIAKTLSGFFENLGRFISKCPKTVVAVSVFSSIAISLGVLKVQIAKDNTSLYIPTNSRIYEAERTINRLFSTNSTNNSYFSRETRLGRFLQLIVIPIDEGSALRSNIFDEVVALERLVTSFQVEWMGEHYNYSQVCAKLNGDCYHNNLLSYIEQMRQTNETSLKYPVEYDLLNMQFNVTAIAFGGVTLGYTKEILDAKALCLIYLLDKSNKEVADKWESEFFRRVSERKSRDVRLVKFSTAYFDEEFWKIAVNGLKYGVVGAFLLIFVCISSSMTSEWVSCKPFLGIAGCISAGLAVIASSGVTALIGFPFSTLSGLSFFFVLGIGVDDMFVMIAAWRKTDTTDTVSNRMGKTYSYAAMSVTMTSLTNIAVFIIGATLPVPVIINFCVYCVFGILFDLIYQLTFFGGCMALDGQREEKKLHPIFFKPVKSREAAGIFPLQLLWPLLAPIL